MNTLDFSGMTVNMFNTLLKQNLNPNSPSKYDVNPYQSFAWAKSALTSVGVTFPSDITSAWGLYTRLDDLNMRYIKKSNFSLGVNNGFDNNTLGKEIPDGSIVFGYFVGNPYVFRAIDEMYASGLGLIKRTMLKTFLQLDNISNVNEEAKSFGWYDETPINRMIFSEAGFKSKFNEVKNKNLIGKKLPIVPINHIGIYYNKHLFHYCSDILVEPSDSLRIVAYYDFKKLFLLDAVKRFGKSAVDAANTVRGLANTITNAESSESLINLKGVSDISNITKKFNI
jgi:hypothetical protein